MNQFPNHSSASAPAAARPILEQAEQKLGFVPNLYGNLAEAPAALNAYVTLSGIFDETSLNATERQVVLLATSVENRCEFCVTAHSVIAKHMLKVDPKVVTALRDGTTLPDTKLQALAEFTLAVVRERGWVVGAKLDAFFAAGYAPRQALEVVLGVAMKTLSNYANHLAGTEINEQFASERWTPAA